MFDDLDPFYPEPEDLDVLATVMSKRARFPDANIFRRFFEAVADFIGLAESKPKPIPAGYTYLSQFIIHDITFDAKSDRHVSDDLPFADVRLTPEQIKGMKNWRNPNFNLEIIYGYKEPLTPTDPPRPVFEAPRSALMQDHPLPLLKLGDTLQKANINVSAGLPYPSDLPRNDGSPLVRIVDPRNDENLLLAQTQVAFMKFHNAIVVKLSESDVYKTESGEYKKDDLFDKARKLAIRYYQTIILKDFLPQIVQESILKDVVAKAGTEELFYQPKRDGYYMPLEFSVAAVRAGHSMIQNNYNFNIDQPHAILADLMSFTGRGMASPEMMHGQLKKLPSTWIINWNLFYDINGSTFNPAAPIDTNISLALQKLRPTNTGDTDGRKTSLPALDLYRGRRFGLPTGQAVAGKIAEKIPGIKILSVEDIDGLIKNSVDAVIQTTDEDKEKIKKQLVEAFSEKAPLWFYILAEAEIQAKEGNPEDRGKLGAVGSWIIAEAFIQLLYESEYSILQPEWEPDEEEFFNTNKITGMPEMLKFVRDTSKEHFETLYPGRKEIFEENLPGIDYRFDELNPLGEG